MKTGLLGRLLDSRVRQHRGILTLSDYSELLVGCGSNHNKRLVLDWTSGWQNLTTLGFNADHHPDKVWDLDPPPCQDRL